MPSRTVFSLICAILLPSLLLALGQDEERDVSPTIEPVAAIPAPYPAERYRSIWENSPFQLDAAPAEITATARVSFTRDYSLVGTMKKGESYTAYLLNKRTNAVTRVSDQGASPEGFRLISVEAADAGRYTAVVEYGGERATLAYNQAEIAERSRVQQENWDEIIESVTNPGLIHDPPRETSASDAAESVDANDPSLINPAQERLNRLRESQTNARPSPVPTGDGESTSRRRRIILPNARSTTNR